MTNYSSGRIDCYCDDENYCKYNQEISIPVIKMESWNLFSKWLYDFSTEKLEDFNYLKKKYEEFNLKLPKENTKVCKNKRVTLKGCMSLLKRLRSI